MSDAGVHFTFAEMLRPMKAMRYALLASVTVASLPGLVGTAEAQSRFGLAARQDAEPNPSDAVEMSPVDSLSSLQGEWVGSMPGAFGQPTCVVFTAMGDGGRIDTDGPLVKCQLVIDPETLESYLYGISRSDCTAGKFSASRAGDQLSISVSGWEHSALLTQSSRPALLDWDKNVPDGAVVRGVKLGSPPPRSASEIDGALQLADHGHLQRTMRRGNFMGMTGPVYLNAESQLASVPESVPRVEQEISFDNIEIFSTQGKVAAVFREYEPPVDDAPQFASVREAIFGQLGEPTVTQGNDSRGYYEWHYGPEGDVLAKSRRNPCIAGSKPTSENTAMIAMRYDKLETSISELMSGRPPRIQQERPQAGLTAGSNCAYSISYEIRSTKNGLLDTLSVVMFAHEPVRGSIWLDRLDKLSPVIARELELQRTSQGVAPKL